MKQLVVLDWGDGLLVLPGTPSKWVKVEAGRIQSFATFMTGEIFALLRQHSILARTLKLFPAEMIGPAAVKALRAVLPGDALLLPVVA